MGRWVWDFCHKRLSWPWDWGSAWYLCSVGSLRSKSTTRPGSTALNSGESPALLWRLTEKCGLQNFSKFVVSQLHFHNKAIVLIKVRWDFLAQECLHQLPHQETHWLTRIRKIDAVGYHYETHQGEATSRHRMSHNLRPQYLKGGVGRHSER